jgi:hypothetical protein
MRKKNDIQLNLYNQIINNDYSINDFNVRVSLSISNHDVLKSLTF